MKHAFYWKTRRVNATEAVSFTVLAIL